MGNLSKRELILLSAVLVIGVMYGYINYFLSPVLSNISSTKANIAADESKLATVKTAGIINKKLKEDLADYNSKLEEAVKALPPSERQPEISYNLKVLADNNKVSLNSVSYGQPAADGKDKIITSPVGVTVSGSYNNVIGFITSIEKHKRLAAVESVNLSKKEGNEDNVQSIIDINFFNAGTAEANDFKYDFNNGSYGKDSLFK